MNIYKCKVIMYPSQGERPVTDIGEHSSVANEKFVFFKQD